MRFLIDWSFWLQGASSAADHRSFLSLADGPAEISDIRKHSGPRLCHLNHCINYSTGIGSRDRITEQPVLPTDCKWTDRVLAEIVCEAAATILQIGLRCFPPVKDINSPLYPCGYSGLAFDVQATTKKPPEQVFPSRDAAAYAFHNHRDIFC